MRCAPHAREVWGHVPQDNFRPFEITFDAFSSEFTQPVNGPYMKTEMQQLDQSSKYSVYSCNTVLLLPLLSRASLR